MRPTAAILALLLTPPGLPSGGFHWQRTVTPPPAAPTAQACILLDAATFANAAPALRDLRLFQDGLELPYAIEESYDPRALDSGTTPPDDRSLYEPTATATIPNRPLQFGFRGGRPHRTTLPQPADPFTPTAEADGQIDLPAHVPIERMRLDPAPATTVHINLTATAAGPSTASETLSTTLDPQHPVWPVTLGANLQRAATVHLSLWASPGPQTFYRAIFEMRRRSLCYQPRSAAPLTLYLGGGTGMAAKSYSYASNFSTALDRPYSTLGPLVPNPDDAADNAKPANPQRKRLLWAASLAAAFFVFSATRMLRNSKSSEKNI